MIEIHSLSTSILEDFKKEDTFEVTTYNFREFNIFDNCLLANYTSDYTSVITKRMKGGEGQSLPHLTDKYKTGPRK